jgi:hypothetical protein
MNKINKISILKAAYCDITMMFECILLIVIKFPLIVYILILEFHHDQSQS